MENMMSVWGTLNLIISYYCYIGVVPNDAFFFSYTTGAGVANKPSLKDGCFDILSIAVDRFPKGVVTSPILPDWP